MLICFYRYFYESPITMFYVASLPPVIMRGPRHIVEGCVGLFKNGEIILYLVLVVPHNIVRLPGSFLYLILCNLIIGTFCMCVTSSHQ